MSDDKVLVDCYGTHLDQRTGSWWLLNSDFNDQNFVGLINCGLKVRLSKSRVGHSIAPVFPKNTPERYEVWEKDGLFKKELVNFMSSCNFDIGTDIMYIPASSIKEELIISKLIHFSPHSSTLDIVNTNTVSYPSKQIITRLNHSNQSRLIFIGVTPERVAFLKSLAYLNGNIKGKIILVGPRIYNRELLEFIKVVECDKQLLDFLEVHPHPYLKQYGLWKLKKEMEVLCL